MSAHHEPARSVPLRETCDVLVCGGGPAGVAAALAAARAGAHTRLLEVHGCLGGIWTAGLLSWVIDADNKPGIMTEIMRRLEEAGAREPFGERRYYAYDPEEMKLLLEQLCTAAGVEVRYHTRVMAAWVDGRRVKRVITESKSGREAWEARVVIDATGDGDVAARAGCGFDLGRPENGEMQPMSLMALLAGVRTDEIRPFIGGGSGEAKRNLLAEMHRAGVDPSYAAPTLFRIREGLFALMANHEYGVSGIDADDVTAATLRARAEVHRLVRALRESGEPWQELRIVATGAQIGVREGRRIHGLYTVGEQDLLSAARHEDAVCRVSFGIDVHSTNPARGRAYGNENRGQVYPYDIPLRALIARDVDGLMMAGRCISGDFIAHSSYRVTGNAVAMGEAAGTVAALAARRRCRPQEVPWPEARAVLDWAPLG